MADDELGADQLGSAQLFLSQVDRRVASYERRVGIMNSGLTTLVGAAAITGSLATARIPNVLALLALAALAIAAVLGVMGLVPSNSKVLHIEQLREELLSTDEATATLRLADRRNDQVAVNEDRIRKKARQLRWGLSSLASAVIFLFASVLVDHLHF